MKAKHLITKYRQENLVTQKQLAEKIGVTQSTIVYIEKGYKPSKLTKYKMAKFFNIPFEEIE